MSKEEVLTIHIDGAARGNPGPAAFAYVITRDDHPLVEEAGCLGNATNNVAEYTALVRALERAQQLGGTRLHIRSDSELLVKQMNGLYKVKNEELRRLHAQANKLTDPFTSVSLEHVRRAQNSHADRLCNEVLDGVRESITLTGPVARPKAVKRPSADAGAAWEKVVSCLQQAAASWAGGSRAELTPEAVARQVWTILEREGLLRLEQPTS
jgi:ribonuclease HI